MKKLFLLCAMALCAVLSYGASIEVKPGLTVIEKSNGYYIDFYMPDYQVVTDTIITMSDQEVYFSSIRSYYENAFDHLDSVGLPSLPFYSTNLILSPGASGTYVTIHAMDTVEITMPLDYTPAQEMPNLYEDYSYDLNYYTNTADINDWIIYTLGEANIRCYQGLSFSLFPCFYEPITRKLTIIIKAQLEISYSGDNLLTYLSDDLPAGMDVLPYNFYDNFENSEYPIMIPPITGDKYLIIAANELVDDHALLDFIDHKEALGYDVTLENVINIGYSGEAVRTYIRDQFIFNGIKYVLLVGDPQYIPFAQGIQEDVDDPPTDLYYSCLSYSDIDEQWKDLSPSVYVGRWPVSTPSQLQYIVSKTINSDLTMGLNYSNQITLFSGSGGLCYENYVYRTLKYTYDLAVDYNYDHVLYDGRTLGSSGHFTMTSRLSSNTPAPTWMCMYAGDGIAQQLGQPYNIMYSGMDSIATANLDIQPFGFFFAPLLGNTWEGYNFAREWLVKANGGVAFLGATTDNYLEPDRYFSHRLFDQLANRPVMTIGEFVANGKADYYNALLNVTRRREAKKYVLYGDPSLYLYGLDISYTPIHKPAVHSESENILNMDEDIIEVQIYSILGHLVQHGSASDIDYNILPSGTYLKVINTENGRITQKIVVK